MNDEEKKVVLVQTLRDATEIVRETRKAVGDTISYAATMSKHPYIIGAVFEELNKIRPTRYVKPTAK